MDLPQDGTLGQPLSYVSCKAARALRSLTGLLAPLLLNAASLRPFRRLLQTLLTPVDLLRHLEAHRHKGLPIIGQLNDQGHLESVLQPLGEHEGNKVPQVQCFPLTCCTGKAGLHETLSAIP